MTTDPLNDPLVIAAYDACPDMAGPFPSYYGPGEPTPVPWADLPDTDKWTLIQRITTIIPIIERRAKRDVLSELITKLHGEFRSDSSRDIIDHWLQSQLRDES